jgi:transmembrane sensor
MSAAFKDMSVIVSSKDIRSRAADWVLEKHASGAWTDEQQTALDAWLQQSPAHLIAYWRLDDAWGRTNRLAALKTPVIGTKNTAGRSRAHFYSVVAVLFSVFLISAGVLSYLSRSSERSYVTAIGGHQLVQLSDKSQIELNTDTSLRIREGGGQRTVWLDRGEAYFQVKHDSTRPFVVLVAGQRVTDFGTKFVVRRDAARVEVAVVEGRVKLETTDKNARTRSAFLAQGDIAVARENALLLTKSPTQSLSDELAWRRGVIIFHHATLAAVATEFNRYNNDKIVIVDNSAAHMTINGTFPTKDVAAFVRLSSAVLGLHVDSRRQETVISR